MKKSNNSGLQNRKNAATKQNSNNNSGVRNKEKFALWAYPDTLEEVEATYEQDNCRSKSEFIEKAIRFYLGYLKQEGNVDYLAPRIKSIMEAVGSIRRGGSYQPEFVQDRCGTWKAFTHACHGK